MGSTCIDLEVAPSGRSLGLNNSILLRVDTQHLSCDPPSRFFVANFVATVGRHQRILAVLLALVGGAIL
jgi:hypothetical protein